MLLEELNAFHTDKPSVKKKVLKHGIPSEEALRALRGKKKCNYMDSNLCDYIKGCK